MSDPTARAAWAISLPLIFAELNETALHVIDTAFLGRVGRTELAALALADTLLEIWLVLAIGLVEAMQIVIARRAGEDKPADVGASFNQGFAIVVGLSVLLAIALKLAAPAVADLISRSDDVAGGVDSFLQIAAYGLPFLGASFVFSAFFIGIGRTRALVIATLILVATNAVLGYGLILGHLGLPRLGLEGAALASVLAEVAAALYLAVAAARLSAREGFGLFRFGRWDGGLAGSLVWVSAPIAVQVLVESVQWFFFFVIIGFVSPFALAVSNVVYACLLILMIPGEAFAESVVSLVSNALGRSRRKVLDGIIGGALRPAFVATVVLGSITLLFPSQVLALFTSDADVLAGAVAPLRIVAGALVVGVPAIIWGSALVGTGDTAAGGVIEAIAAIFTLATAYVLALQLDASLTIVWLAIPVGWTLSLVMSYGWTGTEYWRRVEI